MPHNRRQWLHTALAAALPIHAISQTPQPLPVVIVGAGLAGLAAAHTLHAQGVPVRVLEARARPGGRVHTSRAWPDMPTDLGASWIHGTQGNPLTALARQAGAATLATHYDRSQMLPRQGQALPAATLARADHWRERLQQALQRAQRADTDRSVADVARQAAGPLWDDPTERRLIHFALSADVEQEYAAAAEQLSAHWFDDAKGFDGDDVLFAQGFEQLLQPLLQGLDLRLNEAVQSIDWNTPRPMVHTSRGSHEAAAVIITLPLGVLKAGDVAFNPPLPAPQQQAIAALGMGVLNKCCLRFDRPFWPRSVDWLEHIPAERGRWTEWVSFERAAQRPVLMGFHAGTVARDMESWTDAQVVSSAMDTLRQAYGQRIPEPQSVQITRWHSDPWARGSYSFNALGSHPRQRDALGQTLGQALVLAGEATDRQHFGTAHGAYVSGLRAARQVQQLLAKPHKSGS